METSKAGIRLSSFLTKMGKGKQFAVGDVKEAGVTVSSGYAMILIFDAIERGRVKQIEKRLFEVVE